MSEQLLNVPAKVNSGDDRLYQLIEKAMEGNNADALEKVINLYNQQQDREERRDFEQAFLHMQAAIPAILAQRSNQQTNSQYAKLDDIHRIIKPTIKEYGFSIRYESPEQQPAGHVQVTCILTYENGQSARNSVIIPIDSKGIKGTNNKTETHGTGSALTYARRYALCGLLDITITNDDDGNAAGGVARITPEQQRVLIEVIESLPDDSRQQFYSTYPKVASVELERFRSVLAHAKSLRGV